MKTTQQQIECARRELALRRRVYPGWVRGGRMAQAAAEHEIECMAAIVDRLDRQLILDEISKQMNTLPEMVADSNAAHRKD